MVTIVDFSSSAAALAVWVKSILQAVRRVVDAMCMIVLSLDAHVDALLQDHM